MRDAIVFLTLWFLGSIPTAILVGHFFARRPLSIRREHLHTSILSLLMLALCAVALTACGGGGGSTGLTPTATAQSDPPPPAPSTTGPAAQGPATPEPTQPPLPNCPTAATTPLYISVCQCPKGSVNGSSCVITAPVFCPVGVTKGPLWCTCPPAFLDATDGSCHTPAPAPTPPPTIALTASPNPVVPGQNALLSWTSTGAVNCMGATGWPVAGILAASGQVTTASLNANTTFSLVCGGPGGDTTQSVAVAVNVSIAPNPPPCAEPSRAREAVCNPSTPPQLTENLVAGPATVEDDSQGCPPPDGLYPCVSTVAINVTSTFVGDNTEGQILCYPDGTPPSNYYTGSPQMGPYSPQQDGTQSLTVDCYDPYGATSTANISVNVIPAGAPPPPMFTASAENSDGTYSLSWSTPNTGPGCYVFESTWSGPLTNPFALTPGGTTSGSAVSVVDNNSADWPYSFVLMCGGVQVGPGITETP